MNTKMNFQYKGGELAPFMEISKGYVKLSVRLPRMPSLNNVGTQAEDLLVVPLTSGEYSPKSSVITRLLAAWLPLPKQHKSVFKTPF